MRQAPRIARFCLHEALMTAYQSTAEAEVGRWAQGCLDDAESRED